MSVYYRRRTCIEVTEEQYKILEVLPHGMKKQIFQAVVGDVCRAIKRVGLDSLVWAVLHEKVKGEDYSRTLRAASEHAEKEAKKDEG